MLHTIRLYRPLHLQPQFSPYNPTTPHPHPYLTKHVNHVFMFISYKAISSPLVASVASAAAVAVVACAVVPLAGAGMKVVVGVTVVCGGGGCGVCGSSGTLGRVWRLCWGDGCD